MGESAIPGLAVVLKWAAGGVFWLVRELESRFLRKTEFEQCLRAFSLPDLRVLNCRVRSTRQQKGSTYHDAFSVEICGSIHAPKGANHAGASVSIEDVTEGAANAQAVYSRLKQWQTGNSEVFCYNSDLGRIPSADMTLSDWVAVGIINIDWLRLPRKGTRKLRFRICIHNCESGDRFAFAECCFAYENSVLGYMDLQENVQRARTLAVALAFAVSAADNKMYDCEVDLIKNWARGNIDTCKVSDKVRERLEKALEKTVGFFREGNHVDCCRICREVVEIVPVGERYDILDLCLRVARANGTATVEEVSLLKKLAEWLEVDMERFRRMMEKILPSSMHEVKDAEIILGVKSDMSKDETRRHLNKEYRKWNARVTNSDPEIQNQADDMVRFIAEARKEYIA
ncbi:MAG TPA: tellurite resistance TerB family protein [Sedimentisphaerales bacterium]|nr:tellurite resistance TerB family protein [Sedimentisphaerales bacterium]